MSPIIDPSQKAGLGVRRICQLSQPFGLFVEVGEISPLIACAFVRFNGTVRSRDFIKMLKEVSAERYRSGPGSPRPDGATLNET